MAVHVSERDLKHAKNKENTESETAAITEEEEETKNGAAKKKSKRKAKKGFPFGALLLMFVLVGLILAAGYYARLYAERYAKLKADYENAIVSAEATLAAAEEEYAEADSESAEHSEQRRELSEQMIGAARSELEILRQQDDVVNASIAEAEKKIEELQSVENFDYYKAIYDEYTEGRAYVEEILSGN